MKLPRDLSGSALRAGTAGAVLGEVAEHFGLARDEVVRRLFG